MKPISVLHSQQRKTLIERKRRLELSKVFNAIPTHLAQKTEVMVEHFRTHVRHKIGGRAKAMVVTDSGLHAVRYKQAFDHYIKEWLQRCEITGCLFQVLLKIQIPLLKVGLRLLKRRY